MNILSLSFNSGELNLTFQLFWDRLDHLGGVRVLPIVLLQDYTCNQHAKVNYPIGFSFSLQTRVDTVSHSVISNSLAIAFKVLQDGSPVAEQIRVSDLHPLLRLSVGFERQFQLFSALIVVEEVSQVSIAEGVPRLRILEVKSTGLVGHLDTRLVVLTSYFRVCFLHLSDYHRQLAQNLFVLLFEIKRAFEAFLCRT